MLEMIRNIDIRAITKDKIDDRLEEWLKLSELDKTIHQGSKECNPPQYYYHGDDKYEGFIDFKRMNLKICLTANRRLYRSQLDDAILLFNSIAGAQVICNERFALLAISTALYKRADTTRSCIEKY
jgi:hypothetical protein